MIVVYCDICGAKDATHEYTPSYPWERNSKYIGSYGYGNYTAMATSANPYGLEQQPDVVEVVNPTHFDMCKNCVDKFGKLIENFLRRQ